MAGKGIKFATIGIIFLLVIAIIVFLVLLIIYWQKLVNYEKFGTPACPDYYCSSGVYNVPGSTV
jgi:hypothetical protein